MRIRKAGMVGVLAAVLWMRGERCPLEQGWAGPVPHYDYLRNLEFRADGRGEFVYGYGQAVRCEVAFRWGKTAGQLEMDGRRFGIAVESGRFSAPVNDYPEPTPRDFACRLTFDRNPFPGCGDGEVFYACPLN